MRKLSMAFSLVFAACSSSPAPGGPDATMDDGGMDGNIPVNEGGGCSIAKSPKDDKCTIDEMYGVFVSDSLGSAMGDGSRTKPLRTIQAGIDLAKSTGKNVYVCAEQYNEQLALADGVAIYGYFECAMGWSIGAKRASDVSDKVPVAVGSMIQKTTRIESLELHAPDTTMSNPKTSSIALVLLASPGVKLADMFIVAQNAPDGVDGKDGIQLTDTPNTKNGANAQLGYYCTTQSFSCLGGPGTSATSNTCTGLPNITPGGGGAGGIPSLYQYNNFWSLTYSAGNGAAQPANASTAQGGIVNTSAAKAGAPGADGMDGTPGTNFGSFDAMKLAYVPSDGTAGTDGKPGQGGGGGEGHDLSPGNMPGVNGAHFWGNSGGAGGAGGCPGIAATPATGGHASIGIVAIDSPITIDSSTIQTGQGGKGGKAGVAGAATAGGLGGSAANGYGAGANGGTGGSAGPSGNGGGGPSVGVAFKNGMPVLGTTTTITPGKGGAGVPQRLIIDVKIIPASQDGVTAAMFGIGS